MLVNILLFLLFPPFPFFFSSVLKSFVVEFDKISQHVQPKFEISRKK